SPCPSTWPRHTSAARSPTPEPGAPTMIAPHAADLGQRGPASPDWPTPVASHPPSPAFVLAPPESETPAQPAVAARIMARNTPPPHQRAHRLGADTGRN